MARSNPLPKEVFIFRENDGTKDEYLSVNETIQTTADLDQPRRVGRYVLAEEMVVSTNVLTTIVKKLRR